jgi:hypothetical protein
MTNQAPHEDAPRCLFCGASGLDAGIWLSSVALVRSQLHPQASLLLLLLLLHLLTTCPQLLVMLLATCSPIRTPNIRQLSYEGLTNSQLRPQASPWLLLLRLRARCRQLLVALLPHPTSTWWVPAAALRSLCTPSHLHLHWTGCVAAGWQRTVKACAPEITRVNTTISASERSGVGAQQ